MRSRNFALIGAAALAVSLSALPASAHHGWGGQATSFSDMTGTVVQGVSLAGPHATMKVNVEGKVWDLSRAIENDAKVAIVTRKDDDATVYDILRHDTAHILAEAVKEQIGRAHV